MSVEKFVEERMAAAVEALSTGYQVRKIRGGVQSEDADKPGVIVVASGMRSHDSFSLPGINVPVQIQVITRLELDLDGSEHDAALSAVAEMIDSCHADGAELQAVFGGEDSIFSPAELMMPGGVMPVVDADGTKIADILTMTIRGVEIHPANDSQNNNNN